MEHRTRRHSSYEESEYCYLLPYYRPVVVVYRLSPRIGLIAAI